MTRHTFLTTDITISEILLYATPKIDVLGIMQSGEDYARSVHSDLRESAKLYFIDEDALNPFYEAADLDLNADLKKVLNPDNTLVICDDTMESCNTLRRVCQYLEFMGYDFETNDPLHFAAMEKIYRVCDGGVLYKDPGEIRLVKDFLQVGHSKSIAL